MPNEIEILIVEDSRTQAVQLQCMLEQHGFQVSCATNGREALAMIRDHRPTLLISDIVMPEMDGYQLCHHIREDPQLTGLPVILMTTLTKPGEVIKALESKADNFITKPCQEEFLLSRIRYILTNQELRRQTKTDGQTRVLYAGQQHTFTSDPVQIVDLLLSTFDNALQKNRELERINRELTRAQLELRKLNEQLEDRVEERTKALALSEENHRALLENNADAIIVVDQNAAVRFVNPAAAELLERSAAGLLDTTLAFPMSVGETREVTIPRSNGEPVVTEMRAMQTLWEGDNACVATLRDITLRKSTEATLQRAKDAAEAADRAKSEFLANMSHEIRTPMNGIIGMTGLLLDTPLNAEQQDHTHTVQDCASSLLDIINEILDFSKIEAGNLDLDTYDFDLHSMIEEVRAQFAQQAEEKGLALTSLIHHDVPALLSGDPGRLRQILINFLENALKFTEEGEITLHISLDHATEQQAVLRFAVSDTGIGIPTDRLDCLFQPFSQVDSSSTRKYGGTGLGLALCQDLVKLMQGTIGVGSKLGEGSTFWFSIPLAKRLAPTLPTPFGRTALQGLMALIVDPNQTNRTILEHQLSSLGMETHTAQDGHQALEMLLSAAQHEQDNRPYHIAILDWQMPGMDGLELARAIRADSRLDCVRLVLLTAAGKRGDGTQARAVGINAYLTKPVQESQLANCLRTVMEQETGHSDSRVLITQHTLAEAQSQSRPRLLVVEDNLVNQKLLVRLLEKLDYRADVAPNGQEALTALEQTDYAVVLMDCQLPVMDGFEATARIRERDRQRGTHTPIIAVTAHDTQEDEVHCLAVGMDAYIAKPTNIEVIRNVIAPWIARPAESQHPLLAATSLSAPTHIEEPAPRQTITSPSQTLEPPAPLPHPATEVTSTTPAAPQHAFRVLVTEDNVVNQKLAVRLLEKMGYQVDIAINGRVAVETLAQHAYDIVLMDCQMPEMDGFQATARIREWDQQRGIHTPIIALTAHAIEGDRERCLEAGMDDYVSKPINPEVLKATLTRWQPRATEPSLRPHTESPAATQQEQVPALDCAEQIQDHEQNSAAEDAPCPTSMIPLPPALDLDEALARVDGDKAFLQEMAEIFLTEYPHFLAQIHTALSHNDCEVLMYAAHTLKGSVGNFVAAETYEAAHALESVGRQGDLSRAPLAVACLESALDRLTPTLSNLQAELEALPA